MSRPLVAVVGRPNVGKSTLFNRLIGHRVAIVEDTPGITRDRLYHNVDWRGIEFTVIDTGGIILNETDPLAVQVRAQAEIAMEEAQVILFVVDAADGMTSTDQDIADVLRASKCPLLLVVNKADNPRLLQDAAEFYGLGLGEVHSVSAAHGHGVADLLDEVVKVFPSDFDSVEEDEDAIRLTGKLGGGVAEEQSVGVVATRLSLLRQACQDEGNLVLDLVVSEDLFWAHIDPYLAVKEAGPAALGERVGAGPLPE